VKRNGDILSLSGIMKKKKSRGSDMVHCHIFPVSKKMRKIRHVFFKNILNQGNKKAVTKRGRNVPISRSTMNFIIKLQIDDIRNSISLVALQGNILTHF